MESHCAVRRVKIPSYSRIHKGNYNTLVECGIFTIGGYQWAIMYYPHSPDRADGHISLYLKLVSQRSGIVKVFLCCSLICQKGLASGTETKSGTFTCYSSGHVQGFEKFMRKSDPNMLDFLKDDSFTIQCMLIIKPFVEEALTNKYYVPVPPSELQQNLSHLLETGEGGDVSFKVKDKIFPAYRNMLAARSSVFRAELFGSLKESKMDCIEIEDMEPEVCKSMLLFIYTDEVIDEGTNEQIMSQHLIVAADRYGLSRLRLICEGKLAKKVEANNVVTTLALALRHNCRNLKDICLDYMSASDALLSFVETDEFSSLIGNFPSIYKELLKNLIEKFEKKN